MKNYVLIEWPDSQDYMGQEWFQKEAILNNDDEVLSASYFIPENKYIESLTNGSRNKYIVNRSVELAKNLFSTIEDEEEVYELWSSLKKEINEFESVLNLKLTQDE